MICGVEGVRDEGPTFASDSGEAIEQEQDK